MRDDPNQSTEPSNPPVLTILLPWLTLAAIIGTFAVNIWSNLSPPGGQTIGEISNTRFAEVQITPANYAFAIWGVIYIGLLAFGYYQLLPAQRADMRLRQARPWLIGPGGLGVLLFGRAVLAVGAGNANDFSAADFSLSALGNRSAYEPQ